MQGDEVIRAVEVQGGELMTEEVKVRRMSNAIREHDLPEHKSSSSWRVLELGLGRLPSFCTRLKKVSLACPRCS